MSLSATAVIQAAPNAIIMMNSATLATTQEARLSIEEVCNIQEGTRLAVSYCRPPMI
jgi:ABC-type hemin transport system substrate-binding protein